MLYKKHLKCSSSKYQLKSDFEYCLRQSAALESTRLRTSLQENVLFCHHVEKKPFPDTTLNFDISTMSLRTALTTREVLSNWPSYLGFKGEEDIITDGKKLVIFLKYANLIWFHSLSLTWCFCLLSVLTCDPESSVRRSGGRGDLLSGSLGVFGRSAHLQIQLKGKLEGCQNGWKTKSILSWGHIEQNNTNVTLNSYIVCGTNTKIGSGCHFLYGLLL